MPFMLELRMLWSPAVAVIECSIASRGVRIKLPDKFVELFIAISWLLSGYMALTPLLIPFRSAEVMSSSNMVSSC